MAMPVPSRGQSAFASTVDSRRTSWIRNTSRDGGSGRGAPEYLRLTPHVRLGDGVGATGLRCYECPSRRLSWCRYDSEPGASAGGRCQHFRASGWRLSKPTPHHRSGYGQLLPPAHRIKPSLERRLHSETCPMPNASISAFADIPGSAFVRWLQFEIRTFKIVTASLFAYILRGLRITNCLDMKCTIQIDMRRSGIGNRQYRANYATM